MRLNGYELRVSGHKDDINGYVNISNGTEYSINLSNTKAARCIAEVEIDGKNVGDFVLGAFESIDIERPVNEARKFIALTKGSSEFNDAELNQVSREELGLIKVTFRPEKRLIRRSITTRQERRVSFDNDIMLCSSQSVGTGLGSESDQEFTTVSGFQTGTPTIIYLRLVSKSISPLKPNTTKYPKPV